MSEQINPAAPLIGAIRDASKTARLLTPADLSLVRCDTLGAAAAHSGLEPNTAVLAPEAGEPGAGKESVLDPAAIESLLAEHAEDDIKLMRGTRDNYYFSERFMTAAYALHLFRVAEKDPARMVADTVRDESRIYPRPTPITTFLEPPFRLTSAELDGILWQISQRNDMTDIRRTSASDGSEYLYSSKFLEEAHADSLAEWDAVGQTENP